MHILLIHQAFASLDEGGGTRHYEMACYLAKQGHQITIIASPISYLTGKANQEKIPWKQVERVSPQITIIRTYTYRALHRSFFHRVVSFVSFMVSSFFAGIRVKNVDVIWGTSPPIFQGFTAWLLSRLKGIPFLFEVRDLWPKFAIDMGVLHNPFLIRASKWLERFLYAHADQVIVNSPGYLEHVEQHGARKVNLIPNGVDASMFDPQSDGKEFRAQHNLQDQFIALYAGAHGMANDLDVVLQAAHLLKGRKEICFVLVGDGKEKANLIARAKELELENVRFLPIIPKSKMSEALAAANACIAILKPIKSFKTTYPNKVFDYMAAGRPVILAIDGVSREIIETAQAGIFVQPGSPQEMAKAVEYLQQNSQKAYKMGINGRDYVVENFDRAQFTQQFAQLLQGLKRK